MVTLEQELKLRRDSMDEYRHLVFFMHFMSADQIAAKQDADFKQGQADILESAANARAAAAFLNKLKNNRRVR